jgi:dihydroorotase-like cyclic amidohydrolase
MEAFDLVLRGGQVVLPGQGVTRCDIAVRDGRIAALLAEGTSAPAAEEVSLGGLTVMPGAIDVHLHLGHGADISRPRVPGDAAQESAGAVAGGITCFIPYLMATDPFERVLPDVIAVTEAGSRVDFGYHCIISTEEQLAGVPDYVRDWGAPTFKIFMNNRGGEGKRLGLPDIDDGFLLRLCEAAAACRHGLPASRIHRDGLGAAPAGHAGRSRRERRPCQLERNPAALRGGRCRAARGLRREDRGRAAVCGAHLLGRGAAGRAAPARRRRARIHRDLPPLPDA